MSEPLKIRYCEFHMENHRQALVTDKCVWREVRLEEVDPVGDVEAFVVVDDGLVIRTVAGKLWMEVPGE